MIEQFFKTIWLIGPVSFLFLFLGCGEKGPDLGNEVLIRVGDRVVTILDFNEAFEISKIALTPWGRRAVRGFAKGAIKAFKRANSRNDSS